MIGSLDKTVSRTLRRPQVLSIAYFASDLKEDDPRTQEVVRLVVEMICLSRKKGRPVKHEPEFANAA